MVPVFVASMCLVCVYINEQRSRVPTPQPTPTSSPTQSMLAQHLSPLLTSELSQTGNVIQVATTPVILPTAEAAESLTDDAGDFPSYSG